MSKFNYIAIIPARYASTRFPGKPLALINGKSMIQKVYEQTSKSKLLKFIWVATDDRRIYEHVKSFGGNAIYTSVEHTNGTSRVAEAANILLNNQIEKNDVIVNIQGDEPFINPEQIDSLINLFQRNEKTEIATLIKKITDIKELESLGEAKVVVDKDYNCLYFSRNIIPFAKEININENTFYKHIGIYAYKYETLQKIVKLERCNLEESENLEQLRWLYNGYKIKSVETDYESVCIDTPEDLEKVINNPLYV